MQKQISEHPMYYVTDCGQVKSRMKGSEATLKQTGTGTNKRYRRVTLCGPEKERAYKYVHRLVAEAFLPNPDGLEWVNHKNLDTTDNRVSNLEWCSPASNIRHARDAGRCRTKIKSMAEAESIRKRHQAGESGASIARDIGVKKETIYHLVNGLSWNERDEPPSPLSQPK